MNGECTYYNNLITTINDKKVFITLPRQMSSLLSKIQLVVLLISQFLAVRKHGTPPQSVDCKRTCLRPFRMSRLVKKPARIFFHLTFFHRGSRTSFARLYFAENQHLENLLLPHYIIFHSSCLFLSYLWKARFQAKERFTANLGSNFSAQCHGVLRTAE